MPLTLGNDLTGLVSREVSGATRTTSGLGKSLTTGDDAFVEVVDGFLGSALRDGEIILGALAKNTSYSVNLLTITDEYLSSIASSLQDGLATVAASSTVSPDKLAVLQKNLDDKRVQANLLVTTAKFDGKNLLAGGAKSIDVQVGLNVTDKLNISVKDISGGKLFRTSITNSLNAAIAGNPALSAYYNANAPFLAADKLNNVNLVLKAMTSGANAMTDAQLGALIGGLTAEDKAMLDTLAPKMKAALTANYGETFVNATTPHLVAQITAVGRGEVLADGNLQILGNAQGNIDLVLNGVINAATGPLTAAAVAADIGGRNVPQSVKDAANAAAGGAFAVGAHDVAREVVRRAALDAFRALGGFYELAFLSRDDVPAGAAGGGDLGNAAQAAFGGAPADPVFAANAAASAYLSADVKAAVAQALSDGPGNIQQMYDAGAFAAAELGQLLKDDAATVISTGDAAQRALAQSVLQGALTTIRSAQAGVSSQKSNVVEAADALRASTNVTQAAADSYLKTDYVLAAQKYSEEIRKIVAAVTSLQAANKIPEAAQRLIDALAR